ncbi:putative cytochrome P450 [Tanacetum coccineum]
MGISSIFPQWLLTAVLVLFLSYIVLRTLRSNNRSAPKLPQTLHMFLLIGNLHQLHGKARHQALWQLSKQYGPIMLVHIGSKPFLIISSPSMAKQILKTQDHIFCSRPLSKAAKRLTYNYLDIAFSPQSNHQREMRKILVSELLGPKRATLFNHALVREIETVVQSLSLHPLNTVVNLNELFLTLVKGVVLKVAFGQNYRQQPLTGPSLKVMIDETMELLGGSLGDSFPLFDRFVDRFSGWNDKLERGFANLDAYIESILDDHHNQNIAQVSDNDKDFVDALLEFSSKENASGYVLTKEDMKGLVMDVILGGTNTTAATMVWAMSEITRNTRVMRKLQDEIRNCSGKKQKRHELDITKMIYLKMVVKETLRMHPPLPLLIPHESISHCQIDGHDIFPKTSTLINVWGIGRDPNVWGNNADEFYPERFVETEVEFGMIPFGGGRRSCPGMNTASATIEFILAYLLYWFDWDIPGDQDE